MLRKANIMTGRTCRDEAQRSRKSDVSAFAKRLRRDRWEWALFGWPVTIIGAAGFAWLAVEVLKWWGKA